MSAAPTSLSRLERLLSLITPVRAGEGHAALLFFIHAFLLLASFETVKALRQTFILTKSSAETRSYAVALTAVVLMFLVPLYGVVRRRVSSAQLLRLVTLLFAATLPVFVLLAWRGVPIALPFYMWVGIYGVMVVSQLWAFAAHCFNLRTGQRLFVIIMLGANLGALAGARLTNATVELLTPLGLMLLATLALSATMFLAGPEQSAVPQGSCGSDIDAAPSAPAHPAGGIRLVLRDHYLLLIAMFVMVLNCINSTGDFILADFVKSHAEAASADSGGTIEVGTWIAQFYGNFQFWVTLASLFLQLFVVGRIYRAFGMRGALLVHPTIVLVGYLLLAFGPLIGGFIPIFSLVRRIKVADNGVDYSLTNTSRQALFLPVDRQSKFDGKLAIDTFFVRFGDVLQAGFVFAGLHWLGWSIHHFAVLNVLLALVWIALAYALGREFGQRASERLSSSAPEPGDPIPDLDCVPGRAFRHVVPATAFTDPDPGDVLALSARQHDGSPLPRWLRFDAWKQTFSGTLPAGVSEVRIMVIASDMDGLKACSTFTLRRSRES
jgi:AAA family ATP:ADP antiporter